MAPAKKAAKSTAKKTAAKKTAAKKTAAKKTASKKTAKKTAAKKTAGKKTAKKTAASSAGARENVIVTSKLREAVRSHDVRMSSDLVEALNEQVHELLAKAVDRAKGNGRGTVRANDL
ncbi:hypothetical protein [Egicoccus sp. AB-alg2]|uniref:hypothetical protein n=1 Tax=Egicoccus sp. AB-alg2 TaxID=3242693 RepID=UPI00359CBA9A